MNDGSPARSSSGIVPEGTELPPRNTEPDEDVQAWDELTDRRADGFRPLHGVLRRDGRRPSTTASGRSAPSSSGTASSTTRSSSSPATTAPRERAATTGSWPTSATPVRVADKHDLHRRSLERIDDIGGPDHLAALPARLGDGLQHAIPAIQGVDLPRRSQRPADRVMAEVDPARPDRARPVHPRHRPPAHPRGAGRSLGTRLATVSRPTRSHGVSFAASFEDPTAPSGHDEQYYECVGHRAFHRGDWRAVTFHQAGTPFSQDQWQLFDARGRHQRAARSRR